MDEAVCTVKRNKFGGRKYAYPAPLMQEMPAALEAQVAPHLPDAQLLYWT